MIRKRMTLAAMMLIIALVAIDFAALRATNLEWANLLWLMTLVSVPGAAIHAIFGQKPTRPLLAGYAIFAGTGLLIMLGDSGVRDTAFGPVDRGIGQLEEWIQAESGGTYALMPYPNTISSSSTSVIQFMTGSGSTVTLPGGVAGSGFAFTVNSNSHPIRVLCYNHLAVAMGLMGAVWAQVLARRNGWASGIVVDETIDRSLKVLENPSSTVHSDETRPEIDEL